VNARERFAQTMRYGAPDRVPLFEEGLRDGVLEHWREQGLPPDADLSEMFHFDRRERIDVDIRRRPEPEKWPTSRRDLDVLRGCLDPEDPERFPEDWDRKVAEWRTRGHVLELWVHRGFFLAMGVGDWSGFERAVYQLADSPQLVREILDIYADFRAQLVDRVLGEVEVDCAFFSEPIGGSGGSLLSPKTYADVVLPSYRPIFDVLRKHRVDTIGVMTYTNIRRLIPAMMDAGINCLWAAETDSSAMDYRPLRDEFGRDLRLIGGIDLDVLYQDQAAIKREIERVVPPLLADGGYIPLADGRVRENVPFEGYAHYRRLLEKTVNRTI